jgi:hypothetical protein
MSPQTIQPNSNPEPQTTPEPPVGGPPAEPSSSVMPSTPTVVPSAYPSNLPQTPATPDIAQPTLAEPFASVMSAAEPKRSKFGSKKLLILVSVAFVLLGGSSAAYFGVVLPNQPDHLWNTALSNTGKGYDKLDSYISDFSKNKSKGLSLDGNFKVSGSAAADGTFQGSTSDGNGEFTGSVSAVGLKLNTDIRLIKSANSTPDVYFKVDGVQGIGQLLGGADSSLTPALEGLNNQWYFVDHTLFDQFAQGANSTPNVSADDVNDLLKAINGPTKKYVFTSNSQTAAFKVKQAIGKEKQDGRNTYHYKVGVNKANLKAYNNAVCNNLKDNKIFKLLSSADAAGSLAECKNTSDIDSIKDTSTADVWVDTHTKLIHKVRFTSQGKADSYFDVGQDYQGGDSIPLFVVSHSKDGNNMTEARVDITLNMKTNKLVIKGNFSTEGDDKSTAEFGINLSPSNTPVKVDKPAGAKNLIQLVNDLGFGDLIGQASTGSKDTERKTDINALQAQLEAYNAEKGFYPSLAQVNNAQWRAANLKGLDEAALQDPEGTSKTLSSSPAKNVYSYKVIPVGCDNQKNDCTDYTLTATLSDGSTYIKKSLIGSESI